MASNNSVAGTAMRTFFDVLATTVFFSQGACTPLGTRGGCKRSSYHEARNRMVQTFGKDYRRGG